MTLESCAMMYFAGKKTLPMCFALVLISLRHRIQFLPGFLSVRGTAVQPGLLFIVYGKMSTCNILG